jgi:hypothetical protein
MVVSISISPLAYYIAGIGAIWKHDYFQQVREKTAAAPYPYIGYRMAAAKH